MRIVFMGTPEFAVPALRALAANHDVAAVVTQPDRPRGRGKEVAFPEVKQAATELGIPVFQPIKVRETAFIEVLRQLAPEVIVVTAFGQILSGDILNLPRYGCINIHASLLPAYRGAAPVQYAVMDGVGESGVTTMFMDQGVDTGDILLKKAVALAPDETGGSLHDKLSAVGGLLIVETLKKLEDGTLVRIKQDENQASYVKMLKKESGHIDFNKEAVEIERAIRGLNPWPGAYTHIDGKTIKLWKAEALDTEYEGAAGEAVDIQKDGFSVKTGKGTLRIMELQPEGKKRMTAAEYLRGYQMKAGVLFL